MASQDYFNLAYQSALGSDKEKSSSRETIRKLCAEQGIFPHLAPHNPAVISYTATR
jgi:hypothetical protein